MKVGTSLFAAHFDGFASKPTRDIRALGFIHTWLQPGGAKGEIRPETV